MSSGFGAEGIADAPPANLFTVTLHAPARAPGLPLVMIVNFPWASVLPSLGRPVAGTKLTVASASAAPFQVTVPVAG